MFGWNRSFGGFYGYGIGAGYGFGRGMWPGWSTPQWDEAEWLKRYRDRLELLKKDVEAELKAVDERIQMLEKS